MSHIEPIAFETLPTSIEAFQALQDQVAQTPQGGAAMMVLALWLYAEDPALGRPCLALAVDPQRLQDGALARTAQARIDEQLAAQPYLPRSYVRGAAPANGYQVPDPPYVIEFAFNPRSGNPASGQVKAFVVCSGAASPRPVTVRRDGSGLWRANEWSSLVMGIVAAK